jgi:VWFA-related protein
MFSSSSSSPSPPAVVARRRAAAMAAGCLILGWVLAAGAQEPAPAQTQEPAAASSEAPPAPAAGAEEQVPPAPEPGELDEFFDTVTVEVVNVEVVVTEKGKRVLGLKKEDFELFEDGKRVEISNFYAVADGLPAEAPPPAAETPAAPPPAAPPVATPPAAAPALPADQRLYLVVYIDNFNIRPFNRNRVFRELREFLSQKLRRGDQVMLVSYDRELHVRRGFTGDPTVIASALFELEKLTGHAVHQDTDRRDVLRAIEEAESVGEVSGRVRSYAESLYNDLSFTISALKEFVDGLAGLPGRKAMLYVSDGIAMRPGEDVYVAMQEKFREQVSLLEVQDFDASRRFRELVASANANRLTFNTIDAAGLRVSSSISAENATAGFGPFVDSVYQSNLQAPLQMMAEATGGRAILNSNRILPQLEAIGEDFGTYYSLGYTPSHGGDGRYHRIEVKMKRKGLRASHREGYRDKPVETRMADATVAALTFGFETNPLEIEIQTGRAQARDDGFYLVPLVVRVPIGKLVLVPRGTVHEARLRVFVAAMDGEGNTSEVQRLPVPIRIPAADVEAALSQYYAYSVQLVMRRGSQRAAVGVRDEIAGVSSVIYRTVEVGSRG